MTLSYKRQAFLNAYLRTFNATQAALEAGYASGSARQQGSRLLTSDDISRAIVEALKQSAMEAEEVLARLAEHARGDMGDLIDPATMTIDWKRAREAGKTRLIKKVKQTVITRDEQQTEIFEFELHDAQAALVHIGRHLKLFTDKHELTGADGEPLTVKIVYADG